MCLACEMDAWWFAETAGSTGVSPALSEISFGTTLGTAEGAGETPAVPERAGGTPAIPASPFLCEETRSE
jgi:hypothetical protein